MSSPVKINEMILKGLMESPEFNARAIPHINPEYFESAGERHIVDTLKDYQYKYSKTPTWDALIIEGMNNPRSLKENGVKQFVDLATELKGVKIDRYDAKWLTVEAEKFCKDQALFNAISESVEIYKGSSKTLDRGSIPSLVQKALTVSFDTSVGHDYIEDAESRWDGMNASVSKIPFDLATFNKITGGGAEYKTLNMILAPTHVGKTLIMCHLAAGYMMSGHDVLYITLEMAQEKIATRVDCNILDVPITQINGINKKTFVSRVNAIKTATNGKLIVKEFPTTGCNVNHIRAVINEIRLKKGKAPRILIVDYINLMASTRMKSSENSYQYVKAVSEELRGLAVEENLLVWSATQTNRQGASSSDFDMTSTSESFGLPMTVDFMFAVIRTEDLDKQNQVLIKQLKSRYGDKNDMEKFIMGMDRPKFRLFETNATLLPEKDDPVMDTTTFGEKDAERKPFIRGRKQIDVRGLKT